MNYEICVAANGDKYTYDVSVVLLRDENEVPEYVISFVKNIESEKRDKMLRGWKRAVERSYGWAEEE